MNDWWAIPMLFGGGLFAGGVVSIAWERLPAWQAADPLEFRAAFANTLRRVDRLQPALVVVTLISTIGFAISADGGARTLAGLASAGFGSVLVGSGAWLVPIQRRLVAPGSGESPADMEKLRRQWFRGHQIRAMVTLLSFTLTVVAVVS
jgi:Domain of unknown function (DUF1772)